MENIYLIGFMGTGKTTVAKALADKLPYYICDTDELIVKICGKSIADIFANEGEEYFRAQETLLLKQLAKENGLIISCGGGMAVREENVEYMKQGGSVIMLSATAKTVLERAGGDEARPLLKDKKTPEEIEEFMNKRLPYYEGAADFIVDTDDRDPADIASEIITWLAMNDKLV